MGPLFIGVDVGTSGVRVVCVDQDLETQASVAVRFGTGDNRRQPALWWQATVQLLSEIVSKVEIARVQAIAVDGTSGTMLAVDEAGSPLGNALLYNDVCKDENTLSRIDASAPPDSAARGANSALARAMTLTDKYPQAFCVVHEADWIAFKLSGVLGVSDENNSLKTGYDPLARTWPDWIADTGFSSSLLPRVIAAGDYIGSISQSAARSTGLPLHVNVVAGTTDGCASFLATGAACSGDAVTALGTTMTIKLLCDKPVSAPEFGVYSHRIGNRWLAGGASNTGGKVLAAYFSDEQLSKLSSQLDSTHLLNLDYYPLTGKGERFPINNPQLAPRLTPRPKNDAHFLQAILEGIADIEHLAYNTLENLGAPAVTSIRTVGGGASNAVWNDIRQQTLGAPFLDSLSSEAAVGTASLARDYIC